MFEFKNNNDFILLFEKRLSEFTGAPYVVLTDSCTNAIFLCIKYISMCETYSSVVIPKKTYISVPQTIRNAGLIPILEDIEWNEMYQLGNMPIIDAAVGFKENIYKPNFYMCISFQQKKTINIGKGGAILLNNKHAYETLKRMSFDGRDSSKCLNDDKHIIHGYHMNMTPDDAAKGVLLLNQITKNKIKDNLKSSKDYEDLTKFLL